MTLPVTTDVGVIIGRFQVPELHAGHRKLFETVLARHKRVLVLLGIPAWRGGVQNPLDYKTRELMIQSLYPNVTVSYIQDRLSNEEWSSDVDKTIRTMYPFEKVTLYGGRDGCIRFYTGGFKTVETLEDPAFAAESGTNIRSQTAALPRNSSDFRAGVIYASYSTLPPLTMCVDAAVCKDITGEKDKIQVLLIRKPNERLWRFPGGRLDYSDTNLGQAAKREAYEETGVEVGEPVYVGSDGPISDWRATRSGLAIHSALFYMPYIFGAAKGNDDAAEAQWFTLYKLTSNDMELCHRNFLEMLKTWLNKKESKL